MVITQDTIIILQSHISFLIWEVRNDAIFRGIAPSVQSCKRIFKREFAWVILWARASFHPFISQWLETYVYTIPQPIYSVLRRVGISHYNDLRSLSIDLYRPTLCVADSGVAINLYRLTYLYRQTVRRYCVDIPIHNLTPIVNLYRPMVCLIFIATDCLTLSI
jgi:hypothetical protein